ncbi:hypothetical protein Tbd_1319 [Thiobacillus denitrificans ATCC 25259]|uniref:Uncharacterized protein n=1 Tax=Thiobacillus denitrificans (strain ATCC 25259 / T1) TaxID=292415 RepID=Q3SJ95_THIDA|nr:hypothetical protein [Thiobacillus denitrificans]AAZ97272.1 hypothetical protein Tbd_1319 [Thiobacillus denitrificans ATCC 25259]
MRLFSSYPNYLPARIKLCVLSGLTVALALVPEAIAFAFVTHVYPSNSAEVNRWNSHSVICSLEPHGFFCVL